MFRKKAKRSSVNAPSSALVSESTRFGQFEATRPDYVDAIGFSVGISGGGSPKPKPQQQPQSSQRHALGIFTRIFGKSRQDVCEEAPAVMESSLLKNQKRPSLWERSKSILRPRRSAEGDELLKQTQSSTHLFDSNSVLGEVCWEVDVEGLLTRIFQSNEEAYNLLLGQQPVGSLIGGDSAGFISPVWSAISLIDYEKKPFNEHVGVTTDFPLSKSASALDLAEELAKLPLFATADGGDVVYFQDNPQYDSPLRSDDEVFARSGMTDEGADHGRDEDGGNNEEYPDSISSAEQSDGYEGLPILDAASLSLSVANITEHSMEEIAQLFDLMNVDEAQALPDGGLRYVIQAQDGSTESIRFHPWQAGSVESVRFRPRSQLVDGARKTRSLSQIQVPPAMPSGLSTIRRRSMGARVSELVAIFEDNPQE